MAWRWLSSRIDGIDLDIEAKLPGTFRHQVRISDTDPFQGPVLLRQAQDNIGSNTGRFTRSDGNGSNTICHGFGG